MENKLVNDNLEKIIKKKSRKIGNFSYKKTVIIGNKEVNLSDYMFIFFNLLSDNNIKKFNILTVFDYLYFNVSSDKESRYKWMSYEANEKYNIVFSDNLFYLLRNDGSGEGDKILSQKDNRVQIFPIFQNMCIEILNRTTKYKLAVTWLMLLDDDLKGHARSIVSFYTERGIFLYLYDSNGSVKVDEDKSTTVLKCIKNVISALLNNTIDVEIIEDNFHQYNIGYGIQNMTDLIIKKKYVLEGYCIIYNIFFIFCLLENYYYFKENNLKIDPQNIIDYTVNFIGDISMLFEENYEKFYNFLVFFANDIRENYLVFISDNYSREENRVFLNYLNDGILKNRKEDDAEEDLEEDFYSEVDGETRDLNGETRDLDEEIRSLNFVEKYGGESCSSDDECISKKCDSGKCTIPTFNEKLDLIMKKEWSE
jgi:hypothetical protein